CCAPDRFYTGGEDDTINRKNADNVPESPPQVRGKTCHNSQYSTEKGEDHGCPYPVPDGDGDSAAGRVPFNILTILDQLAGKHGKESHNGKRHNVKSTWQTVEGTSGQEHARGKEGHRNIPKERGAFQPGCICDEEE